MLLFFVNVTQYLTNGCYSQSLPEMMGELFQPHEMPEPPKQSFFIGLFGGGSRSIDREELCMIIFIILIYNTGFAPKLYVFNALIIG